MADPGTGKGTAEIEAAHRAVTRIAEVATQVASLAGVGASEVAGMIVSCLAARPELTERFLIEGAELLIVGEITPEHGCLTFHRRDGKVTTTLELRITRQVKSMEKTAAKGTARL